MSGEVTANAKNVRFALGLKPLRTVFDLPGRLTCI